MKNMFHLILNAIIIGLMMIGVSIGFLMLTDSSKAPVSTELKVDYSIESIRNPQHNPIKGNPEKWSVLSVNEDYSIATILKEDGHMYYMTIFSANDTSIDIEVNNQIHTFYYTK